jgi:hypothetical protein
MGFIDEIHRRITAPRAAAALLAALLLAHGVANVVWISRDLTLRSEDAGPHLDAQAQAYNVVAEQGLAGVWRVARGGSAGIWPGAGTLPWVAGGALAGQGLTCLRLLNLVFIGVLVLAVYGLGRRLGSESVGLIAATLVSLYPLVYGEGRQFGADLPGAAMTALTFWALVATDRLSRMGRCAWLGLALGFGVLIRPQVLLFVVPGSLVTLGLALLDKQGASRRRVLLGALLAASVAAAISGVWWVGRLGEIAAFVGSHQEGLAHHSEEGRSLLAGLSYYLHALPRSVTPFQLLTLALAGGALLLELRGKRDPRLVILLVWLLGGLLILAFFTARSGRYLLPLCPALALVTAYGLCAVPHRGSRRLIIVITLGVASLSWFWDSFFGRGAPAADPALRAATEVSALLQRQVPGGARIGVHLEDGCGPRRAPVGWLTSPVLRMRFRGIRISGIHHRVQGAQGEETYLHIGRASLPILRKPATRCFRWTCRRGRPDQGEQGERLFQRGLPQGMTLSLWPMESCDEWRRLAESRPVLSRPPR